MDYSGPGGSPAQVPLFAEVPAARRGAGAFAERLAREHAEAASVAVRIPRHVRFGTSSWSFPGWEGLVFSRRTSAASLARDGLLEYARHPLLTTVGIDRGFYAPIPREDLARYAQQLPPGFLCCAKAPESVTGSALSGPRGGERRANPDFLNAARFEEEMLAPFRDAFSGHTGPVLLQFPPAPPEGRREPGEFAQRLDRFLGELPRAFSYAVELRDPALMTPEYARVLGRHGVAHVYNAATDMPMPAAQAERVPVAQAPFTVIRLLLRPGTRYQERREEFVPFDRIVDPNPEMRRQTVALIRASGERPVYVLVNNKAEGCAPATIRALAEELAGGDGPRARLTPS